MRSQLGLAAIAVFIASNDQAVLGAHVQEKLTENLQEKQSLVQ
jgi:hypothetical protein